MLGVIASVLVGIDRVLAWPLRGLVALYRKALSPALSPACRFVPSCSEYAAEALRVHGFARGGALAAWRICRCQPFAKAGWDPVPQRRGACDCSGHEPGGARDSRGPAPASQRDPIARNNDKDLS